jgi:hypothetical protein
LAKKHRNLIGQIIAPDNFERAYGRAAKGRKSSAGYLNFKEHDAAWLSKLRHDIQEKIYEPGKPREFWVHEPKPRPISADPFRDRVVQHALCSVISPIFEEGMMPQSYACRKGRGMHGGAIHTQALMRRMQRGTGKRLYVLKTDFSKYFYSIQREALWRLIDAKITCEHTRWLIEQFTAREGTGLLIGRLTSQLWGGVYGTSIDRFLAQTVKTSAFVRYMDDLVILSPDYRYLHELRSRLGEHCYRTMGLTFSKWNVAPVEAGVNFLGYRIFPGYKLLRKDSVQRARRKIISYTRAGDVNALRKFLAAWIGHAQWADSRNLIESLSRTQRAILEERYVLA